MRDITAQSKLIIAQCVCTALLEGFVGMIDGDVWMEMETKDGEVVMGGFVYNLLTRVGFHSTNRESFETQWDKSICILCTLEFLRKSQWVNAYERSCNSKS